MPTVLPRGPRLALSTALLLAAPVRVATAVPSTERLRTSALARAPTARRATSDTSARPDTMADYRLRDQFGREHRRAGGAPAPTLYVLATRAGAVELAAWTRALRAASGVPPAGGDTAGGGGLALAVVAVVALPGVPGVFRGAVRRLLTRAPAAWMLLDWEQALAELRAPAARCTVALVAHDGRVLARTTVGGVDSATVRGLVAGARAASL